jgi:hypothetical protein
VPCPEHEESQEINPRKNRAVRKLMIDGNGQDFGSSLLCTSVLILLALILIGIVEGTYVPQQPLDWYPHTIPAAVDKAGLTYLGIPNIEPPVVLHGEGISAGMSKSTRATGNPDSI